MRKKALESLREQDEKVFPALDKHLPLSLQRVLNRIEEQQVKMGYFELTQRSNSFKMKYIRDITLALHKEISEMLDELPWKPWKGLDDQVFTVENAAMELCDVLVFTFVIWITLDPTISIEDAMEKTLAKIDNRIKHGYGQQQEKN